MKTAALVITALAVLAVLVAVFAIRGLRKFVRSVWPHS
jgi:hypothetical protein